MFRGKTFFSVILRYFDMYVNTILAIGKNYEKLAPHVEQTFNVMVNAVLIAISQFIFPNIIPSLIQM